MQSLPLQFSGGNFPLTNLQNNVGLLTMPNSFYPAFSLGIANFDTPNLAIFEDFETETSAPENAGLVEDAVNNFYDPFTCALTGYLCGNPELGLDGLTKGTFTDVVKKIGIMVFALVILVMGLYLLAQSTKTGSAVINLASKV